MVSLRSGSTTDHKDAVGPDEVSSKRQSRRLATKKGSRLGGAQTDSDAPSDDATATVRKSTRTKKIALAPIIEIPQRAASDGAQKHGDDEGLRLHQQRSAAASLAIQQSLDTPAKHTRARSRQEMQQSALKPSNEPASRPASAGSRKPAEKAAVSGPVRAADPVSAQEAAEGAATSNYHHGGAVAAPAVRRVTRAVPLDSDNGEGSSADGDLEQPAHEINEAHRAASSGGSEEAEGSEEALSGSSESEGSESAGRDVRLGARSGAAAGAEQEEASSSWSSEEGEEESEGVLNGMAQSMLEALQSMNGRGGGVSSGGDQLRQDVITSGGTAHSTEEELVEELRWEPSLKLPAPVAAGDDASLATMSATLPNAQPLVGKQLTAPLLDPRKQARAARKAAPDTAGKGWFDLPAQQITPEVKRDLRLIRLRGAMDPQRFYKSLDQTKFPKYFQFGTVVEGPADFYAGRMTRKQRKGTLAEEVLADPELAEMRAKRFGRLQEERSRWARKKKRPTTNERKKVVKRPRH